MSRKQKEGFIKVNRSGETGTTRPKFIMEDYAHSVNAPTINEGNLQNVAYFKMWEHRFIDMFPKYFLPGLIRSLSSKCENIIHVIGTDRS